MPTDFRRLQNLARALGLTYQQLLAQYHTVHGPGAPRSGALAWARLRAARSGTSAVPDTADAQQELDAGLAGSLTRARDWTPRSLRLDPEVLARLVARADTDHTEQRRIAPRHYIDAALRTGPRLSRERLACTREFLRARGGSLPRTMPITVLLGPDAHAVLTSLRSPRAAGRPDAHAITSALTDHFLNRLPPQPPAQAQVQADRR
ncbi:hypothetical protein [Streptomyces clavuligerus]|uniref:hypothetical protein n=1 Tax=Streptomyces clavuligerus TaxID=1901 RepID=UPI000310DE35|nr:hypothetical protein [Streptomyces clavuligerus]WDN56041.1 hypothetical protein LL058_29600 [Streptomyces clavuligerus]